MKKEFILFTEDMLDGEEDRKFHVFTNIKSAKKALKEFHDTTMEAYTDEDAEAYYFGDFNDESTSWEMYLEGEYYTDHSIAYIVEKEVKK